MIPSPRRNESPHPNDSDHQDVELTRNLNAMVQDDEKLTDSAGSDSLPDSSAPESQLRSSPTSIYAQTMGLHQRQRHIRTDPDDSSHRGGDEYYHSDYGSSAHNRRTASDGSPDNKYGKPRYFYGAPRRRRAICGARTQSILLVLALGYLALAIYMYQRVASNDDYFYRDPRDAERLLELVNQMEKLRVARSFLDERETSSRRSARNLQQQRGSLRSNWTRLNINGKSLFDNAMDEQLSYWNDFARRPSLFDHAVSEMQVAGVAEPANWESLCGFHAQNASLSFPHNYLARDALGPQSRILITGITNMLGIRLALMLRDRCRAHVVAAIDPTFPNTISNRLRLLEPLQLLVKHVPKLDILWGYMGLDPLKNEDVVILNATGELDIVQTFQPTHIVHLADFFLTTEYNNLQHPYVASDNEMYRPSLYQLRSSLAAMEQILMSISFVADETARPHFVYASPAERADNRDGIVMSHTHRMQEIMANTYFSLSNVQSNAIRLPDVVLGPWYSEQSPLHSILAAAFGNNSHANSSDWRRSLGFLHVDDAADALIAAMQFRSPRPVPLVLGHAGQTDWTAVNDVVRSIVSSGQASNDLSVRADGSVKTDYVAEQTRRYLSWYPRKTIHEGIVRTLAWYLDTNAPTVNITMDQSGSALSADELLTRYALVPCPDGESTCSMVSNRQLCASECSRSDHCAPSMFDSILDVMYDVTDGCDIVLYTQVLDNEASDLKLQTEYADEGIPLICTVAFVAFESPLVQSVVQKVPEHQQVDLGVVPQPEHFGSQEALHKMKRSKLNGRLLYQGWILVWPDEQVPAPLPHAVEFLLKLAPGRLFSQSVKHAVFIDERFGVSPKQDDIKFLVYQLKRNALPKRTVKKKTPPKTKIRLPAEPARRAAILLSELRQQESLRGSASRKDKLSIREASRFMRFECGERSLGKEPLVVKAQREFYEHMVSFVNRNTMRSPLEPQYTFAMRHWARTRWVVHDLELAEGRQLRCAWYKEHLQWEGSSLDQLSFAYVMAKQELARRLTTEAELTDRGLKVVADWTEIKRLLTDVFEWHALWTAKNSEYTPYGELTALPYDHVDSEEGVVEGSEIVDEDPLLFARIISDRTMAAARDEWNTKSVVEEPAR